MLFVILFILGIIAIGWIAATMLPVLAGVIVFSIITVLMALLLSPLIISFDAGKRAGRKQRK